MEEKIPKTLVLILLVLILVVGAFLGGVMMFRPKSDSGTTLLSDQKTRELEEKDRQIQGLENQMAQMRRELEDSSKQVAELRTRLEEATKALSFTQQKLQSAMRQAEGLAVAPPQPRERPAPRPVEPTSPPSGRRPAEPGSYEVIRTTPVFEEPSGFSRKVSTINKGTRVTVVGSVGEWLEVRSKRGNPPGFIRRDDAMFMERRN